MRKPISFGLFFILSFLLFLPNQLYAGGTSKPKSDRELIRNAKQAAPRAVARDATIMAMGKDGKMRTLRQGTNGWTCLADNEASPGNDPMCLDPNGMEWVMAMMNRQPPPNKVGFGYMLMGGSDVSNIDPYAPPPERESKWIKTGPHIMIFGPPVKDMPGYVTGANPDTSKPYVMWKGTPYEHLMIPI